MELKHRKLATWWTAALLLLGGPAWAQAAIGSRVSLGAVDIYRNSTQRELAQCIDAFRRSYRRMWLTRSTTDYHGCISEAQNDANAKLVLAARALHRADAQRALVAYHRAFLAAIHGIEPGADEMAEGYEQRQSVLLHLMSHAWSRYELVESAP